MDIQVKLLSYKWDSINLKVPLRQIMVNLTKLLSTENMTLEMDSSMVVMDSQLGITHWLMLMMDRMMMMSSFSFMTLWEPIPMKKVNNNKVFSAKDKNSMNQLLRMLRQLLLKLKKLHHWIEANKEKSKALYSLISTNQNR